MKCEQLAQDLQQSRAQAAAKTTELTLRLEGACVCVCGGGGSLLSAVPGCALPRSMLLRDCKGVVQEWVARGWWGQARGVGGKNARKRRVSAQ